MEILGRKNFRSNTMITEGSVGIQFRSQRSRKLKETVADVATVVYWDLDPVEGITLGRNFIYIIHANDRIDRN